MGAYRSLSNNVTMKKKILITGASGLLGANLALHLSKEHIVHAVYNTHGLRLENCSNYQCDLTDKQAVEKLLAEIQPKVIVHCAAWTSVDACEEDPAKAQLLNVDMTHYLLAGAPECHFVYISTDAVFDGSRDEFTEEDVPAPVNVYGKTKLASEKLVKKHVKHTILRTNIYGWNVQDKSSFPEWVLKRLGNNEETPVFSDFFYKPILVNTLSKYIQKIINNGVYGLFHTGSSDKLSKAAFADKVAEAFGLDKGLLHTSTLSEVHLKAKRPHNLSLNSEKIKNTLGIELETTDQGIAKLKKLQEQGFVTQLKNMLQHED
jgi:dTDP-4-dehydrorhamnose reductase